MRSIYSLFLFSYFIASSTIATPANSQAAVAMPDKYSAEVAKQVMLDGGNAIDAAIAAQFVLAVTLPEAGNIGGGGFMLVYKDKLADFLDYREVAPSKAHRDMYLDKKGNVIENLSLYGILSAGVPGTVDGMWQAHKKYATKPWETLLAPAIKLAEQGFVVHQNLVDNIEWRLNSFEQDQVKVNFADYFGKLKTGSVFKQPELAATLRRISEHGREGFYSGETANIITKFMADKGGIIDLQDLADYRSKWRAPIQKSWREYQILTAPPPSSGGIAVLQWLTMFDLRKTPQMSHNSGAYIHLLAEIGKRVFADRAEYLGDPDFVEVPQQQLLDHDYLVQRSKEVSLSEISVTANIQRGLQESRDTTHFSIVDQWGNAVSNTTTINYTFGSGVIVEGAGFILNDEMDDFSVKPGSANVYGAIGGSANEIQAGKRMLSSMSPTIVLHNEQIKLVTGSPGGTTIISSVYQSILNALEFGMNAQDAANAPRTHHQLWPKNQIEYYGGISMDTISGLEKLGYGMLKKRFGEVQMIIRNEQGLDAGSEQGGRAEALVF
ncbi:gamma-glutamyltransferase [Aliiglaciecola sp. LCG003]|uniref:gamma-glutamyltransferase n=1 Tax=Aliiglaciecola sp. LCG003 TaxID=3053655 RepID=UPI002573C445|nr:gamma-glutamyltransferase [Aliiglaciecola sp. LCG003]WJG07798.1 gamma-glutamyltransferase [Aliiglaciecola sp. LCG003]